MQRRRDNGIWGVFPWIPIDHEDQGTDQERRDDTPVRWCLSRPGRGGLQECMAGAPGEHKNESLHLGTIIREFPSAKVEEERGGVLADVS